jgi:hypothetical protein
VEGTLSHDYEDFIWHLLRLRRARLDGKLTFVLGSGINKSYNLPDWRQLLEQLLLDSGRVHGGSPISARIADQVGLQLQNIVADPLLQAAIGRQGYVQPSLWIEAIRGHIEEQASHPAHARKKPLYQVANLIMGQYEADRRRHVSVLTFNYDDLLEKALRARARKRDKEAIISISRAEDYAISIYRSGVFVYHLHGDAHSETSPILDATSYLRILGSPGRHWSWDCLNASLFQRDSAAMFIGLSLVDPSLRLLLTEWAEKGLSLSGVYVSAPPPAPSQDLEPEEQLKVAKISRDIVQLFDEVLEQLSLIPYHVTVWDEVHDLLLEVIADDDEQQYSPSSSAAPPLRSRRPH